MRKVLILLLVLVIVFETTPSVFARKKKEKPQKKEKKEIKYIGLDAKRNPFIVPKVVIKILNRPQDIALTKEDKAVKLPKVDLQGIVWAKGMPQAIVNDRVIKIGDYIGDFEVKEITREGIKLFLKGKDYFVTMQSYKGKRR